MIAAAASLLVLMAQQGTNQDPTQKKDEPKPAAVELKSRDLKVGTGVAVKDLDILEVEYVGKLTTGKVFDQSKKGKPFKFIIGAGLVIKGWDQGVMGMKVGGTRELTIPSELGYGAAGAGAAIPPNSTLVFEITVTKIVKPVSIEVLKEGEGAPCKVGDFVSLRYRGTLKDGKEFDSNTDLTKEVFRFQLGGGVIPGFTRGVIGMKLNEKRKIVIPSDAAYGAMQIPDRDEAGAKAGSVIPKNSDLTFELELVRIDRDTPVKGN